MKSLIEGWVCDLQCPPPLGAVLETGSPQVCSGVLSAHQRSGHQVRLYQPVVRTTKTHLVYKSVIKWSVTKTNKEL